jgi:hypothetical protein
MPPTPTFPTKSYPSSEDILLALSGSYIMLQKETIIQNEVV